MEKRWCIKYIGNHWVGCSHTTPQSSIPKFFGIRCTQFLGVELRAESCWLQLNLNSDHVSTKSQHHEILEPISI